MRTSLRLRSLAVTAALLALFAIASCGRNRITNVLTPTGFRPAPVPPTGALYGFVYYDSLGGAGIRIPPFPATTVALVAGDTLVAQQTLPSDSTRFHFDGVPQGDYRVRVTTADFLPESSAVVRVLNTRVDAGNVRLALPGAVAGRIVFDRSNAPDLASPPYPLAVVRLLKNGVAIASETLTTSNAGYRFAKLAPGSYTLEGSSPAFKTTLTPSQTVEIARTTSVPDLELGLDPGYLNTITAYLTGDIPNFGIDQIATFESALDQNVLGLWTYPNSLYSPTPIPAGTYRFKLVTDNSSTLANLVGWGWSETDTLQVPFTDHPVRRAVSGRSTDIVARFPSNATYQVILDERRQTLTIVPAPAFAARAGVRKRP